jgi:ribonuclease G
MESSRKKTTTRKTTQKKATSSSTKKSTSNQKNFKKKPETSLKKSQPQSTTTSAKKKRPSPANEQKKQPKVENSQPSQQPQPPLIPPKKLSMIFAREAGYEMAGILEEKRFTDFWISEERGVDYGKTGNIYRGVVSKVLPSLNAAFINIGLERDGFLSFSDLCMDFQLLPPGKRHRKITSIHEVIKPGDRIMVQMQKEAIADKGPSLTRKISIPGRFLVYMPSADTIRMSRMLSASDKTRFRKIVKDKFDVEGGLIFRTASIGKSATEIQRDLDYLSRVWQRAQKEFESGDEPFVIHRELDLYERVLRDNFSPSIQEIILDHPRLKYRVVQFLKTIAPDTNVDNIIRFHTDKTMSVWKANDMSNDLDRLFRKKIRLDCGGYIIIEEMETLTAIDVNSGKNIAGKSLDETIFETNLAAAKEVPRQLRLRQIGGIIIVDFIDMHYKRHRDKVFQTLQEELDKDRTPSDIQEFTDLGLIQITRQRSGKSLTSQLTYECAHCNGSGRRPTFSFE